MIPQTRQGVNILHTAYNLMSQGLLTMSWNIGLIMEKYINVMLVEVLQ